MAGISALEVLITQGDAHPDLNQVLRMLENLSKALAEIDRTARTERSERPRWVIDDLEHREGLYTVRLTAGIPRRGTMQEMLLPITTLVDGAQALRELPEVPRYYTETTVARLTKIAGATQTPPTGIRKVELATVNGAVGPHVPLDAPLIEHAKEAVKDAETSIGSVTGRLDAIKRIRMGSSLTVFNVNTHRVVSGFAPAAMSDELRGAWGHRVIVRGRITRNSRGQAIRVQVSSLETLPDDDSQRAPAEQIRGAAPDWTGGLTVEQFVDRGRRRA